MSEQEIDRAIAEKCGWVWTGASPAIQGDSAYHDRWYYPPADSCSWRREVPYELCNFAHPCDGLGPLARLCEERGWEWIREVIVPEGSMGDYAIKYTILSMDTRDMYLHDFIVAQAPTFALAVLAALGGVKE